MTTLSLKSLPVIGLAAVCCVGFAAPQGDPINRVRWLTGCWEAGNAQRTAITDSSVTFENPTNDFPTRVGYNRRGADSLIAWISGPRGGTTRRIDFPFKRAACE